MAAPVIAVFAKPWKSLDIPRLAAHIRRLGFTWIELPVRPGFACEPDSIETCLPEAVRRLAEDGVYVLNVTAALPLDDERLYAACAKAGIQMNRVMFERRPGENYWDAEDRARRVLDAAMPFCERYHFRIGVQNHSGSYVGVNAMGLHHLLKDYPAQHAGAIWDPAHNALQGEDPEAALDIVQSHLCLVNLKNAYWQRTGEPGENSWRAYWTTGPDGLASWPRVAEKLRAMHFDGPFCMSAEYSDENQVDRLIMDDLSYARECLAR